MATSKITPRTQSLYHRDEGFDFEKFFYSIYSFTDPIIEGENLHFTTTFIYEDDKGQPYGQYRIGKKHKSFPNFDDKVYFLENKYKIYLNDPDHKNLSIFKIYNNFTQLSLDKNTEPLDSTNLRNYFVEKDDKILDPGANDFSNLPLTVENFLTAESIYVEHLFRNLSSLEKANYLPLPIISMGNLVGIIYFIIDRENFREKGKEKGDERSFKDHYRSLLLSATREYERVRLESKFDVYAPKPEEPLEEYLEVFYDLIHAPAEIRKSIDYSPIYGYTKKDTYQPIISQNPFLRNLGYDDYYEHQAPVLIRESYQLQVGKRDRIRTAIIAIVVDSFAHNVGAHSLVALKWWFENRYRIAAKKFEVTEKLSHKLDVPVINGLVKPRLRATMDFHKFMDDLDHSVEDNMLSVLNIIRFMNQQIQEELLGFEQDGEIISHFPIPVAQSIYQFFQYLRDKSAFWSGVARDIVVSGRIKSWAELIRDFLNNTLFLGTIAHSEGINKVYFYVEIVKKDKDSGKDVIDVSGQYAQVNLEVMDREMAEATDFGSPKYRKDPQGYSEYAFLRKGKDFEKLHLKLEKLDHVFLPNGIVGQHALFTILENTLRNVKHYKKELKTMKKEGIRLYLSLQSTEFIRRFPEQEMPVEAKDGYDFTSERSLFKVGAWLHHPQELLNEEGSFINEEDTPFDEKGTVIGGHTQQLRNRVVNSRGYPILGGSSQDKVCAAMLMNNRFESIDEVHLDIVKRHYFPYVYAASEFYQESAEREMGVIVEDSILHKAYNPQMAAWDSKERQEKYKDVVKAYIKEVEEKNQRGNIKKYFHVWKGRRSKIVNEEFNRQDENLSRFKVIAVAKYLKGGKPLPFRKQGLLEERKHTSEYELRKEGVIRLIEARGELVKKEFQGELIDKKHRQKRFDEAIQQWIGDWLGNRSDRVDMAICQMAGKRFSPSYFISLIRNEKSWKLTFTNLDGYVDDDDLKRLVREDQNRKVPHIHRLNIVHGDKYLNQDGCCQIRSHCAFMKDIFAVNGVKEIAEKEFKTLDNPSKLIETVLTHITLFDDRVYERIPMQEELFRQKGRHLAFKEQLRIQTHKEDPKVFENTLDELLSRTGHFIILHLSFIESITQKSTGKKYNEDQITDFFKEEIEDRYLRSPKKEIPHNLILVIVSGRGRGDWFTATEHPQITFRSIEAILGAIEDGLSLKDDFQVKYNLCNVLFGS